MSPKRKTKKALLREEKRGSAETDPVRSFTTRGRPRRGPRGTMTAGGSRCVWCGAGIPDTETARTFETPPEREHPVPMPAGSGWVICGEDCPELPAGAGVFYRTTGWKTASETKTRRKRKTL